MRVSCLTKNQPINERKHTNMGKANGKDNKTWLGTLVIHVSTQFFKHVQTFNSGIGKFNSHNCYSS